ncbi:AraC family transcriptional regulator [Paenibacillus sp. NPDC056579]|uniref:AraC family transcriptional regulator n=1 Tax=unclassified Paenibacillus TaxID=185978 RepID=UPI001EF824DA|nr:AraC family transcriptional regulator [Paenibacillus sp. H1-7]
MKSKVLSVYFGSRAYPSVRELHRHEYWQLEIVTQGAIQSTMLGEEHSLDMGDMLLVPPGWEHGFTYNPNGASWLTLKFEREDDGFPVWGGTIHGNQFTSRLVSSFKTVIHDSPYKSYEEAFVNGFLDTMFHYVQSDDFHKSDDTSELLVKLVMDQVKMRNGRAITINELAEELSYTRSHLSKKFKEITGESLKSYIDQVRIQKMEEQLRYREQSISEIAADLGFNDIFSFSKFFKKHTGESPRQFNRKFASWRS